MSTPQGPAPFAARIVGSVFGAVFALIGVSVIVFLWGQGDAFGAPPLFFRFVGSLIALCFVVFGSAMCISTWKMADSAASLRDLANQANELAQTNTESSSSNTTAAAGNTAYACPRCGAPLAEKADVSPHGDVRCGYCQAWFNIHNR